METRTTPQDLDTLRRQIEYAHRIVTADHPHDNDPAEDAAIRAVWREVLRARLRQWVTQTPTRPHRNSVIKPHAHGEKLISISAPFRAPL